MASSIFTALLVLLYLNIQTQFVEFRQYFDLYSQARLRIYRDPQGAIEEFCHVPKAGCQLLIFWKHAGTFVEICSENLSISDPRFRPIRWYKLQLQCSLTIGFNSERTEESRSIEVIDVQTMIKT